jgi:hypothetical protein
VSGPPTAETLAKRAIERAEERARWAAELPAGETTTMAERAKEEAEAYERSRVKPCPSAMDENPETSSLCGIARIKEMLRSANGTASYPSAFLVRTGDEGNLAEIEAQYRLVNDPWKGSPLPSRPRPYGTTEKLFSWIKEMVAQYAPVSEAASDLLTFWILSTWLQEAISLAPCLLLTGPAHEGETVLRALNAFCRNPMMLFGLNDSILQKVQWSGWPTLLVSEPNLSKRMAALVGTSTRRGFTVFVKERRMDFFCPKAIFAGDELTSKDKLQNCLHIALTVLPKGKPRPLRSIPDEVSQSVQNQLLNYRLKNLSRVKNATLNTSALSAENFAVGEALGSCVFDAPELQERLIALLTPYECQQTAERADSFEGLTIEAVLTLCHAGKTQAYAREIADEVNLIQEQRGEALRLSPAKVGHKLKKLGLFSRRLDPSGNGLILDLATRERVHQVAATYLGDDWAKNREVSGCPLCQPKETEDPIL